MEETSRLIASRYRLRQKVGQGAMGVVWQAYDEQLHRVVAAKELLVLDGLDAATIERAKARAMREARLAARLEHPNAIRVYDVVEEDGRPWLIMEYLPSRSLAAVIAEQGTLPPREVARIGCYTAAALAAAHRHGIQHRDVKPGNVLIGDQEVKITDFGISRATDGADGTATATGTVGTPAFFSPEVARGEDAGLPSDVFSLGATLYNAVEGGPPFGTADNNLAMLHRVAGGSIMPPANAGPLLSPVLFRLMSNNPERRPTMEEAVHLLAAVVNESPKDAEATAVIPATVELPKEAQPEEKAKRTAAAAAAGLVAGAAATEAAGLTSPPAQPGAAEQAAESEADAAGAHEPEAEKPAEQSARAEPAAEPVVLAPVDEVTVEEPAPEAASPPADTAAPAPVPAAVPRDVPPTPPPAEPERDRRRIPLVPIAVVLLVIAVGVGAFFLWPKGDDPQANDNPSTSGSPTPGTNPQSSTQAQASQQSSPQSSPQAEPPAQSQTNPATSTPTPAPPPPPAGPQNAQEAITAYYALMPGDLQTGWSLLTDRFKAGRQQTFQTYQTFWSQYTSVRLSNFAPQGNNVVTVTVEYLQGSAVASTETHTYTFVQQNGKWMIDNQA
ncbi:Serine/threonine protein kinase [Lentzea xinjiangensis]|uniref:non-specific serine/threonine protein kinase n=1 Tax=Lentzea xinjiangensis TaxID=402600 RepID=A0A1H9TY10_9PSEU|nr:serine/threonine-protein kinase [Lentzea xinjiangensis]SES01888.1 Serine/threonine protein kinase [Lentzea xinjiangensis]